MADTLVYTISTGRSGTSFLSKFLSANLPGAEVHHERTRWDQMGVVTPEASHFMTFNNAGNVPRIAAFWKNRLAMDAASKAGIFVETSHFGARAGLIENLAARPAGTRAVVIAQSRDVGPTLWSLHNRCDFRNHGFTWLFTLDSRYRNVIVTSKPFQAFGMMGSALWYVIEMQVRACYYQRLLSQMEGVDLVSLDLSELAPSKSGGQRVLDAILGSAPKDIQWPERSNVLRDEMFGEDIRAQCDALVARFPFDADDLAAQYWNAGRRLGSPPWVTYKEAD